MSAAPGLVIAAPASGSGKTVLTLALLRALRNRGLAVRSAKAGPDYIDPAYHSAASGADCLNLDAWAMRPALLSTLYGALAARADLVLIEGVMGLFDGARDGTGATADLAAALGLPVLLVVDVRGQAASVAALVRGFASHRPEVRVAGVIANRVGGTGHREMLADALASIGMPLLGCVPRSPALDLPDRHLGLVQAREHEALDAFLFEAAAIVGDAVDLEAVVAQAQPAETVLHDAEALSPLGQRVAVAQDTAFGFCYPHLLHGWRAAGAEILPFSPLADEAPATMADAVYLPGGYPELHAEVLAANRTFHAGMAAARDRGALIYGECGGYMVLGEGLTDAAGVRHAMLGLLPLETSFAKPRLQLGYRRIGALGDLPFVGHGSLRGHEFHYSSVVREGGDGPLFFCSDARGEETREVGARVGRVCGSFLHVVDVAP